MRRWTVKQVEDGYVVYFRGDPLPHDPIEDEREARAYMKRVRRRWRGESARFLVGDPVAEKKAFRQGGPWRFVYPDGEERIVRTSRKSDALKVERHRLKRKRLPNGTVVEFAG